MWDQFEAMKVIDFHAHAFPDKLAERAMKKLLSESPDVTAYHDGKISGLLKSMDAAGIEKSVICSIATRPEQFEPILEWSKQVASDRIVAFPSFHPLAPNALEQIDRIADEGFKGIKLHPYYQDFFLDEPMMLPLYARMVERRLIIVCHTGFDIAFPRIRKADPARIAGIVSALPSLKFVATHLGGWEDWDNVEKFLIGKPVYMEISYTLGQLPDNRVRDMLMHHPADRILFGTDSPWQDQAETVKRVERLALAKHFESAILRDNAGSVLGI